jgi:hypothetical protein
VLFSNLDELSNKGLIKGLIMLSHAQDKKIKAYDQLITNIKTDQKKQIKEKDIQIKKLNDEIGKMKKNSQQAMRNSIITPKSSINNNQNLTQSSKLLKGRASLPLKKISI